MNRYMIKMLPFRDFNSVWAPLPCCLSKCSPEQDFLDNYLTTFFGFHNFQNTSASRVTFFLKMFKI